MHIFIVESMSNIKNAGNGGRKDGIHNFSEQILF